MSDVMVSSLINQKSNLTRQKQDAQNQIISLNNKMNRLKEALRELSREINEIKAIYRKYGQLQIEENHWSGVTKNTYLEKLRRYLDNIADYLAEGDLRQMQIKEEITRVEKHIYNYESQIANITTRLSHLTIQINHVKGEDSY